MRNELIQLLTERVALLTLSSTEYAGEEDTVHAAELPDNDSNEQRDEEFETVLVDFDFDHDNQENFDVYMNIRYFWNDWNPILTDIY